MSTIDSYLQNSAAYAAAFSKGDLAVAPAGRVAIVACMDARLDTARLLGLREGDAHVIRNAGGIVSEDVIRSLAISQCVAGTREIMLIHHTDCAMCSSSDDQIEDAIHSATGAHPSFAIGAFADLEQNVRDSIARIQASPDLPHREVVRGFVYDVKTGRLSEVA